MKGNRDGEKSVVPLAGVREKLQGKLDDSEGLAKDDVEMLRHLKGKTVTFHLHSGLVLPCEIVAVSRYDVLVIVDDSKRTLMMKHAVDFVEVPRL